jgi:hypothetical protein
MNSEGVNDSHMKRHLEIYQIILVSFFVSVCPSHISSVLQRIADLIITFPQVMRPLVTFRNKLIIYV